MVNPVVQLSRPQSVPSGELLQSQPALPLLLYPSRALIAAVPQLSVLISSHAPTVASRAGRRTDAPRLPLTPKRSMMADEKEKNPREASLLGGPLPTLSFSRMLRGRSCFHQIHRETTEKSNLAYRATAHSCASSILPLARLRALVGCRPLHNLGDTRPQLFG